MMESNYEKTKEQTRLVFLQYDQEKMIEDLHLDADEEYLYFDFICRRCRVERISGAVECEKDGTYHAGSINEAMTVYDLLCWSDPTAVPSGNFVTLQTLSHLFSSSKPLASSGFDDKRAKLLDHRDEELREALHRLGGEDTKGGDVAAEVEIFNGLKALFRFWDSDDEFDAQIQILWDENTLKYMHYETVWYASGVLLSRVLEEMN